MSHFGVSLLPIGIGLIIMLILLIPSSTDGMKITLRVEMGERWIVKQMKDNPFFTVEVEGTDSVATLKEKITDKIKEYTGRSFSLALQTLRLNKFGLALEDTKTMQEYGIKDDQTIIVCTLGEFQIDVKYGKKRHSVNVKDTDTVATLKGRIENIKEFGNIPHEKQILIRDRIIVFKNSETMDECRIKKGDTVTVSWEKFEISVKYDEKEPINVEVNYNDLVKDLKEKIKEKFGIPPEKQKLSHLRENFSNEEEILSEDTRPIYDYDIVKGETIFMSDAFQITVEYKINGQPGSGKVEVKGKDTVKIVKGKITAMIEGERDVTLEEEGTKMELYKSEDTIFKDDQTMDECGIAKADFIYGRNIFGWKKISEEPKSASSSRPKLEKTGNKAT